MLSVDKRLEVATPNCVADDFGGEIVAVNLETGYYFSMRDLAGAVWRDLAAHNTVGDVVSVLAQRDPALATQALALVVRILLEGLMRPAAAEKTATAPVLSGELADQGTVGLELESYDDMRDLVLTDPIHDVDEEVGWPVRRNEA